MTWLPKDTAPTDGTRILIWDELNREVSIAHYVDDADIQYRGWFHYGDWLGGAKFSHWQPCPPKPAAKAGLIARLRLLIILSLLSSAGIAGLAWSGMR